MNPIAQGTQNNMEDTMDKRLTMVGMVILVCLIIGGCAMKVNTSGKNIMIEYHPGDSSPAYDKARQICESKGMDVKQEGTACPHFCVTTFQCVAR